MITLLKFFYEISKSVEFNHLSCSMYFLSLELIQLDAYVKKTIGLFLNSSFHVLFYFQYSRNIYIYLYIF